MKIEIKNRWTGKLIFEVNADSIKLAVLEAAYKQNVSLADADLSGADLRGVDLRGADLSGVDLRGADLRGADLRGAYLRGADLSGADLIGADLSGAVIADDLMIANSSRPFICVGPLGSEVDQLSAFLTEKGIYLRRGCFFGTSVEFKAAVKKKHAKNQHGKEYAAALKLIELHFKLYPAKGGK